MKSSPDNEEEFDEGSKSSAKNSQPKEPESSDNQAKPVSKPEAASEKPVSSEKPKNVASGKRERQPRERKPKEISQSLGAKKLGATKIDKLPGAAEAATVKPSPTEDKKSAAAPLIHECWEEEVNGKNLQEELRNATEMQKKPDTEAEPVDNLPEELMSNLTFKDIFKPAGWEGLGDDVELPDDLGDDKYRPVLNKLAASVTAAEQDSPSSSDGWGGWGSWGALLSTASVGVSTLTSHMSQGLSMLEESMGVPSVEDLVEAEEDSTEVKQAKVESPADEKPKADGMNVFSVRGLPCWRNNLISFF